MAVYLVGPDDTSLFHKRTTWDFDQALEKAADGDTIEIQQGFSPQTDQIIRLKKNITIQGHVQINTETNHRLFTNTIGAIFVSNQAQVTLKDICIQITSEKSNAINVKGASNVIAQRVLVESLAQEGVNYPVIYAEDNSKIDFYDVTAQPSKIADGNFSAFILDSTLTVANSWLGCRISLSHSAASLKEVTVVYHESNALYMEKESTATVIDSWLDGGKVTEKSNWPCVRVLDSKLTLTNSSVLQPNFNAALSGKNATFTIDQGNLDSVALMSSVAHISQVTISESLAIKAQSVLQATTIFIKGIANGNINLFGNQQSKIQADQIYFGMLTDPNIKMEQDVDLDVGTFKQLAYNQTNHTFIKNEKNLYTITADAGKIVFFGEKPALVQLNEMIGLPVVKNEVEEFVAMAEMNKRREDQGLANTGMTLHSLFLGNPGTGKTTVARIVGKILYQKGIVASDKFVETSRTDLVAGYVGQTAIKTREKLEEALGGVLFIDEAYTLANGSDNDFGSEAINEILKFMEDHRDDLVIIFAGYTDNMTDFLKMNEGLASRIPNRFNFEDYTLDELAQIGLSDLNKNNYTVNVDDYTDLIAHNYGLSNDHSNGRWIRNLNEQLLRKVAVRLARTGTEDLSTITAEDILATKL